MVDFAAQMQPLQVRHLTTSPHTGLERQSTAKVGVSSSRSLDQRFIGTSPAERLLLPHRCSYSFSARSEQYAAGDTSPIVRRLLFNAVLSA